MINVQLIPNAILQATANEEAATPAAPLTPQNHGLGRLENVPAAANTDHRGRANPPHRVSEGRDVSVRPVVGDRDRVCVIFAYDAPGKNFPREMTADYYDYK